MMKINKILLNMLCVLTFAGTQLWGQKMSHHMTEEEKALMPAYVKSQQQQLRTFRAPHSSARSIAEFEPNEGVLIAHPLGIPGELVAEMSEDVKVITIVDNATQENQARKKYKNAGVNMGNCQFVYAPHDSHWTRDYGPMFITEGDERVSIVDFIYDRPRPNDNDIPNQVAKFLSVDVHKVNLVMTGGNYMSDGMGTAAATDLIWEENSDLSKNEINSRLNSYLGIKTHHVTEDPLGDYIKHIDCWGKFLDVDKVLITEVPKNNSKYAAYERVADYFKNTKSAYGNNYQVYRVYASNGEPYTNSMILNNKVLVPIKGTANDNAALNTYRKAMPGYEVIGFKGSWYSTDALHCRVHEIADRGMLYINHTALWGTKTAAGSGFSVLAKIVPYSKQNVHSDSLLVYYSVDNGNFKSVKMSHAGGYNYSATIPVQSDGSSVKYYIHAADRSGRSANHPFIGAADPHEFTVKGGVGYELNDITTLAAKAQNCSTIVLSWTDNSTGEDGFRVRRKIKGGSYVNLKDVTANSTGFTDNTAKANTSYAYMVLPFKGSTVKTSNTANAKTETCSGGDILKDITDLKAKAQNCTTVVLKWTDNSTGEEGFRVRRKTYGGRFVDLQDIAANSTSFTDHTAKASTVYIYMVRPFKGSKIKKSNRSSAKTGTCSGGDVLNNITDLTAKAQNCTTVVLKWTDNSKGEEGFRVRRKTNGGSYIDLKDVAANSTGFTDKTAKANTSYTYMVLPFKGSTIKTSNSANAKTGTCPGGDVLNNITDLTAKAQNCTTIVLNWTDNSKGEEGFRVRRKRSGGSYVDLKDVAANSTSFIDKTATANTSYTYMVRPFKGSVFKNSNLAYATTKTCGGTKVEITINDIITDCNKAKKARNVINFTVKGTHNDVTSNYGTIINRGGGNYALRHVRLPFGKTYTYYILAKNNGKTVAKKTQKVTSVKKCPKSAEQSIANNEQSPALVIYPDPAENYLQIKGLEYGANIKIYNITGTQVMDTQVQERIDISNLKPGIYMLISGDQSTKFIKK